MMKFNSLRLVRTISALLLMMQFSLAAEGQPVISIKKQKIKASNLIKEIKKQTRYDLLYSNQAFLDDKILQVEFDKEKLERVLESISDDLNISYEIKDKTIILFKGTKKTTVEKSIAEKNPAIAIQQSVKGIVKDNTGKPLFGASVAVKGSNTATPTAQDGTFSLNNVRLGDVLIVKFMGFSDQKVTVNNLNSIIEITLTENDNNIEDVVVTALGIKKSQKTLSYQVQKLDGEDLATTKGSNFLNSLVGKVAGAQINTSASGPGGGVKLVLRGSKSIALDNNALYVIDGIPMNNFVNRGGDGIYGGQPGSESIADINLDDIEEISVMTGPSAAALYGYRGANGVVLITTKKGKNDRTSLSISHNTMFSTPAILPRFQNKYGNAAGSFMSWGNETNQNYNPSKFFQTGYNVNNAIALSTGSEKSQNYFSVAANNAEGIVTNNKYNRYNFAYRNSTNFLNNKLLLDVSANYIIQNNLNMFSQGEYQNPLPALYLFPRGEDFSAVQLFERYDEISGRLNQFWPYGDQGLTIQNPYWTMNRMDRNAKRQRYMLTASLRYKITEDINITGRVNTDNMSQRYTDNRFAGTLSTLSGPLGRHILQNDEQRQFYADVIANYVKNWDPISLNFNVGGSILDNRSEFTSLTGDLSQIGNYFSIENMDLSVGTFKRDQNGSKQQTQSAFATAEVGYNNYLFLNLTGRQDWDSALAKSTGPKSFSYGSVGLSAVISEMTSLPSWFSYLKLRGAYAGIGKAYGPYQTALQYVYDDQTNTYSLPKTRPNFDLKPEMTYSQEYGIDMRFLNNLLTFNLTYYSADTKNQTHLISESGTEYTARTIQTGNVRNSGVEVLFGVDKKWNDFAWSSNVTYSYNKNKVVTLFGKELLEQNPGLDNSVIKAGLGRIGSPIVKLTEGGSLGDIYSTTDFKRDNNGYIFLNPTTLLPSMENLNPNDYRKLGSTLPTSHVGWRNSFTYKDIKLNVALTGRFGGLVVSNTQAIMDRYGVSETSATTREKGGIEILQNEISAEQYYNVIAQGTGLSDYYVYKADNIRVQELSVEYRLKKAWLGNKANATVGLVGNNLFMLYNKAPFDPESTPNSTSTFYSGVDNFMQPSLKSFGFNIKFQF